MSCMTIPEVVADIRNNITILRMVRPPAISTENVLTQLCKFANNVEQAYERLSAAHRRELAEREHEAEEHATEHAEAVARDNCRDCILRHPYRDFGGAGASSPPFTRASRTQTK